MSRRRLAVVPVVVLAVALTGCGGGVSKSAYVTKADATCGAGNGAVGAIAKPSSLPDLATAAGTVAATADTQAAGLRKLKAPGGDKAQVNGVIGAIADVAGPARALQAAAAKPDDAATAQAANDLKAKVDAAAVAAQTYGLTACGKGLQAPVTTVFDGARTVMKAAFVARAESLCTAANKKADALSSPSSAATAGKFLAAYIPIEDKLFNDIKALAKPPGDEGTIADMLAAQDQIIAKDKEVQAAIGAKANTATIDRLTTEEDPLVTAANSKFDAYGLKMCGTLSSF